MMHATTPEQYNGKPDPSEPWRYVCPECAAQVFKDHNQWVCKRCRTRLDDLSEVWDKKHDRRAWHLSD
jgi:hypothetical protein